ncbi:unnamed protein product [Rotaria magnacalcarata]|uniref:Ectonucleoside triphosphate diphosphohydrolase 1 n=1 Tax=Rotaria magnacalcarata TaxID=392030 RepID=A0A816XRJ1_9BILA|nr:unnamed protein product [Rotaria magnacalcarata]CAF3790297.1 unnamed protein product [Rotaria magnacalcarata]
MEQKIQQPQQKKITKRSIINFCQGVAITLFLLTSALIIFLIIAYCTSRKPLTSYAIVFDAGSSHTEMFVYYWPADKSDGLGTTSAVNQYFVCPLSSVTYVDSERPTEITKLKAISDFEQHVNLLASYFRPCLEQAMSRIPSDRHKFSPVFLGATAGMRLSLLHNATRAKNVLESIREVFSNSPFQFVVNRQVRILTGMEEAIDGWITTNILLEKFTKLHAKNKRKRSQNEFDPNMVGVLDLGGASTQVTFTHLNNIDNEPIPDDFTTNITLFDTVYSPYAHSYLCWGKNEALKRYRARLLNAALNTGRNYFATAKNLHIRDPCLANGTNDTVTVNSLFRSPCTANEKQRYLTYTNKTSFKFIGSGNAAQCRQAILNLFDAKRNDRTVNCTYKQDYCTFDDTFQPKLPEDIKFIALSGYYYVFNNLAHGMKKPDEFTAERYHYRDFQQEEIDRRLINVCETNYSTFYIQESMTPSNEPHKRSLCFDGWYMWLLLTYAIGFTQSDLKRLTFANTFPTGKVGWTLGYMINQTNYIPAEFREKALTKTSFIGLLSGSLVLILITFIFLLLTCYLCLKKKSTITAKNKDGYMEATEQANV